MTANELDFIKWEDKETGIQLYGRVRKVLERSVIVDVIDIDYATVVSHKRYQIIKEGDVDAAAGERVYNARRKMGRTKWF